MCPLTYPACSARQLAARRAHWYQLPNAQTPVYCPNLCSTGEVVYLRTLPRLSQAEPRGRRQP
ncbi:MAG TPA: hypothetical protein VGF67_07500 [Ktedonobacteraceae bacterium]